MSDRTLYEIVDDTLMGRTAVPPTDEGDTGYEYPTARPMLDDLVRASALVKVEPCEHGNYAPHIDPWSDQWNKITSEMELCGGTPEATDV